MGSRPLIAIVGRPSVGKSTLFNRLIRRRKAIVEASPGVTRDRHFSDAEMNDRPVTFVDTGGFVPEGKEEPLARQIRQQAQAAIEEGAVVLFVVDGKTGPLPADEALANQLRVSKKPIVLVVNKLENAREAATLLAQFHALGLGEPIGVSAEHGLGIEQLFDAIDQRLGPPLEALVPPPGPAEGAPVRLAIVGRPNVGKSTLVNALLGEERVIVSPIAGTTRDPIDTPLTFNGRQMVLTDTAGIRRKSVITQKVEGFSVLGALRAAEDADVVALVLDATEAGVEQDQKIAAVALEKGRALLLVVNKWDAVHGTAKEDEYRARLKWYLSFVSWAPMVFVSAKSGLKVKKVLEVALQLVDQQSFRASTPLLNRVIEHVTSEHPMPVVKGRPLKLYYAMQVGHAPPAFAFICNEPTAVPDRYARYVSNYLRDTFRLKVPIRLFWRERPGKEARAEQGRRFKKREENRRKPRRRAPRATPP